MTTAETSGPPPSNQTVSPGQQAVFTMDYDPRTVNVQNSDDFDGQCIYVWIYASATTVTPTVTPVASQANISLKPPPPDSSGGNAKTLAIYNTGGATLTCTERSS